MKDKKIMGDLNHKRDYFSLKYCKIEKLSIFLRYDYMILV